MRASRGGAGRSAGAAAGGGGFSAVVVAVIVGITAGAYCLALVAHHEARDQSPQCRAEVMSVVLERASDRRWPDSICDVATDPGQFSGFMLRPPVIQGAIDKHSWDESLALAMVYANYKLPRSGATNYWNPDKASPEWGDKLHGLYRCEDHVFGRDG